MNIALWAAYKAANDNANRAYRRRGCPDCGDIAVNEAGWIGGDGYHCRLHLLMSKETA